MIRICDSNRICNRYRICNCHRICNRYWICWQQIFPIAIGKVIGFAYVEMLLAPLNSHWFTSTNIHANPFRKATTDRFPSTTICRSHDIEITNTHTLSPIIEPMVLIAIFPAPLTKYVHFIINQPKIFPYLFLVFQSSSPLFLGPIHCNS